MHSKEFFEKAYKTPNPWLYSTNPGDKVRKSTILNFLKTHRFRRALDIGCGEGWITQDLPSDEIFGYEISDLASSRFPPNVKRVLEPEGKYDLIIATGCMYYDYDYLTFLKIIKEHASHIILLCNIKDWEVKDVNEITGQFRTLEFPYVGCNDVTYTEKLRLYDVTQKVYLCHNIGQKINCNYNTPEEIDNALGKLTFDGCYLNVWLNRELLKNRDVTLFLMGNYVAKDNAFDTKMPLEKICDWWEINDLVKNYGCKLGWHTWSHRNLLTLAKEDIIKEVAKPTLTGALKEYEIEDFAYPYGDFNDEIIQIVKDIGYKKAYSVYKGDNSAYQLRREYL